MPEPLRITEVAGRTLIRLSSWAPKSTLPSLVPPGLGGEVRALPLGPSEWWIVSDRIAGPKLCEQLERHTAGGGIAAVDLSSAIKALRIEGSAAREILAKGCGLDLYPSRFAGGRCARTRLAQLAVVIDCTDPAPRFDLYVGRSYFQYLHQRLVDAAVEFQMIV
jgi:sarcosine oxidase subunit gamma